MKKNKERITVADKSIAIIGLNRTTKLGNRNGKKNNFMDISTDKLAKSYTRRHVMATKKRT